MMMMVMRTLIRKHEEGEHGQDDETKGHEQALKASNLFEAQPDGAAIRNGDESAHDESRDARKNKPDGHDAGGVDGGREQRY